MYHAEVQVASVDEVNEAPRRANRHIHPAAQLADLLPNVHAPVVAAHDQTRRGLLELTLHLLCQLARGRQDDAAGGLPAPGEAACVLLQAPAGNLMAEADRHCKGPVSSAGKALSFGLQWSTASAAARSLEAQET